MTIYMVWSLETGIIWVVMLVLKLEAYFWLRGAGLTEEQRSLSTATNRPPHDKVTNIEHICFSHSKKFKAPRLGAATLGKKNTFVWEYNCIWDWTAKNQQQTPVGRLWLRSSSASMLLNPLSTQCQGKVLNPSWGLAADSCYKLRGVALRSLNESPADTGSFI